MQRDLDEAIAIIKSYEGIMDGDPSTVNLDPYLCPADFWTIGWGHVVINSAGEQLKGKDSKKEAYAIYPKGITMEEAENLLNTDVDNFSIGIEKLIKTEISNNQFCALVSLAFNIGLGSFKNSTLLRVLNSGYLDKVPDQILRWNKVKRKISKGLVRRRKAEVALWNK